MMAASGSILQALELAEERAILWPLTVAQYHRMIEDGVLPEGEPLELLDGYIFHKDRSAAGEDPMTVGHLHVWVVKTLARFSARLRSMGCHLQTQQPVSLPPYDEPEPDGAIVLGKEDDYHDRLPSATEVTCVVEVADSSLQRDRTTKLRIYAAAGIPCYIIINLADRVIEVYTQPMGKDRAARYGRKETLSGRQSVQFPAARGRRLAVPVRKLLP